MSKKPESLFRKKVTDRLNPKVRRWGINDNFAAGIPDHRYRGCINSLWAEYKYYVRLPRVLNLCNTEVKKPALSRLQQIWLRSEHALGTNVCVVVGCPEGVILFRDFAWEKAIPREDLILMPIDEWVQYIEDFCGVNDETNTNGRPPNSR